MKKTFIFLLLVLSSCTILVDKGLKPSKSEFTNRYTTEYTGIDTLILIDGYYQYILPKKSLCHENIQYRNEKIMFYENGLVCITYESVMNSFVVKNSPEIIWGTYELHNDTIECQFIEKDYVLMKIEVSKKTYLIQSKDKLLKINSSDNRVAYTFHRLGNRIGYDNWLLKKKWFWKEGYFPKK